MYSVFLITTFYTRRRMRMSEYRCLSAGEVEILELQGCTAEDWGKVQVASGFSPEKVWHAHFSGEIRLGCFQRKFIFSGGVAKPAGIYAATLHNVSMQGNCRIANVRHYLANYHLAEGVLIENADCICVEENSSFGNGVQVAVLNEAGKREVCMYEALSAQVAYLQCNYRHDPVLQQGLQRMGEEYASSKVSSYGMIGANARVSNVGNLRNVRIGEWAVIEGVAELEDGTVCSTQESPAYVGRGVIARQFIFKSGSKVVDHALLTRCLVGESSYVGRAFTATDSLIFSNCHFENGEACSLFAGPFTVSHHKSTLLIGMMTSFMNAGSGTNQSNHAYKLGPIHYGILERGCRTGSGSYLLWPARIGAFSTIIGAVKKHINTTLLPFSYLVGVGDEVYIAPAATLRSIGTWRDAEKWPDRDGRKNPVHADVINSEVLSPYTVERMLDAHDLLREIRKEQGGELEEYTYQGARIRRSSLERGMRLYEQATRYWAGCKIREMEAQGRLPFSRFLSEEGIEATRWVDLAGMLLTRKVLDAVLKPLYDGRQLFPHDFEEAFRRADADSESWSFPAVCNLQKRIWGGALEESAGMLRAVELWVHDSRELFQAVLEDGMKEFSPPMQLASGIDASDSEEMEKDFASAGGRMEDHPFLDRIRDRVEQIRADAFSLIKKYKTGVE